MKLRIDTLSFVLGTAVGLLLATAFAVLRPMM